MPLYGYGLAVLGVALIVGGVLLWRRWQSNLVDKRIAAYQNALVTGHFDEVQNIYRQMRGWRHDYHNHIQTMKAHLALGQLTELEGYLNELDADLVTVDTVYKTGNVMVDAILNSKISLARSRGIAVNAKAQVPAQLTISEVDLCVIIGNLMDNATEACMEVLAEERFIRVYIDMLKQQLYITVTNSAGQVKKAGKKFITTKGTTGGRQRGFGLMRVDKIVGKYGGTVNRQHEEGAFATEVLL